MDMPRKSRTKKPLQQNTSDERNHWPFDVEMHRRVELEAYLIAEKEGFTGNPCDYWMMAEKEVGYTMPSS